MEFYLLHTVLLELFFGLVSWVCFALTSEAVIEAKDLDSQQVHGLLLPE